MAELLQEIGVQYSDKPVPGLREFRYKWERVECGRTGISRVYCFNATDFNKLLAHWNRAKRWHYTEA